MPRSVIASFFISLAILSGQANAESGMLEYPASEFDNTPPRFTQSVGNAAQLVASRQNVFEPLRQFREDDRLRRATQAVGMLIVLKEKSNGEKTTGTCTATVVDGGKSILTNHHCIPGSRDKVVKARFVLNYFHADSQMVNLGVATEPTASNEELDFAILPLATPAPASIPSVTFSASEIQPRERLIIVHHPAGMPKMLTQFGCIADPTLASNTRLRHRCDTLGGSSGAPIFNQSMEIVGIHHRSGLTANDPDSFNLGSRISRVLKRAPMLSPAVGTPQSQQPAATSASQPAGTVDKLNDLISGD